MATLEVESPPEVWIFKVPMEEEEDDMIGRVEISHEVDTDVAGWTILSWGRGTLRPETS